MKMLNNIAASSVVAIALGAGSGWWGESFLRMKTPDGESASSSKAGPASDPRMSRTVRELRPIITNLSAPASAWVRVELALLVTAPTGQKFEQQVSEFISDATDFLRTVTAQQLEGPGGLRRLREDLFERARFRLGNVAEAVLIQTLVVQ